MNPSDKTISNLSSGQVSEQISNEVADSLDSLKAFYEGIIDTVSDGIRVIDAKTYQIVYANSAHLDWIGCQPGEILNQPCHKLYWGLDRPCSEANMDCIVAKIAESGKAYREVVQSVSAKSTRPAWHDVAGYPMTSEEGEITHVVIVARDITERMEMEQEVAAGRDRLAHIVDAAPVGMLTTDRTGLITSANQHMVDMVGMKNAEAMLGVNILSIEWPHASEFADGYHRVVEKGETVDLKRVQYAGVGGERVVMNIRAVPLTDSEGKTEGVLAVVEDVTERVSLEHRIQLDTRQLSMLSQIGDMFQASMDLEQILQAILVGVTAGEGLGFNRAFLLLADHTDRVFVGTLAIGPSNPEEADYIWQQVGGKSLTLADVLEINQETMTREDLLANQIIEKLTAPMDGHANLFARSVRERRAIRVDSADNDPEVSPSLAELLGTTTFAVVPSSSAIMR